MHKPESVLKNEMHKLSDFEIQTEHLISAHKPNLVFIKKIDKQTREFAILYIMNTVNLTVG